MPQWARKRHHFDYPYFQIDAAQGSRPYIHPEAVRKVWQAEFETACREGTLFLLTMHPQVIGHRSRLAMLEGLIQYMQEKPGVWFATHEAVARYVLENNRPDA